MKSFNSKKSQILVSPKVLLNVCTHGNERVGLKIAEYFLNLKTIKGELVIHIANKKAVAAQKRYIDSDLNRVFPGRPNGNYEEVLAYQLTPFIKSFDYVFDIHSTETGMKSTLIVTSIQKKIIPLLKSIAPKQVVYMSATKSNALISQAKYGIAFEYGKDNDIQTYNETIRGIRRALVHLGLITDRRVTRKVKSLDLFNAYCVLKKPKGYIVQSRIKNFVLIPKGTSIGTCRYKEDICAPVDFYPILFGRNTYKEIFGFMAKKKIL
jgi:predicted deacylase